VHLGIQNDEAAADVYRLELRDGDGLIRIWPAIRLEPGQAWGTEIVPPSPGKDEGSLEALLYRSDSPGTVYRRVTVWSND
jgi:hypothetical protein